MYITEKIERYLDKVNETSGIRNGLKPGQGKKPTSAPYRPSGPSIPKSLEPFQKWLFKKLDTAYKKNSKDTVKACIDFTNNSEYKDFCTIIGNLVAGFLTMSIIEDSAWVYATNLDKTVNVWIATKPEGKFIKDKNQLKKYIKELSDDLKDDIKRYEHQDFRDPKQNKYLKAKILKDEVLQKITLNDYVYSPRDILDAIEIVSVNHKESIGVSTRTSTWSTDVIYNVNFEDTKLKNQKYWTIDSVTGI